MHWLYLLASLVSLSLAMARSMPTLGVLFFLACALGFIPDLSHRMIAGAVRGLKARESRR